MSERSFICYVESVSSSTVTLEPDPTRGETNKAAGGVGIKQIVVSTLESTAEAGFWGATGQCGRYDVIIRRVG